MSAVTQLVDVATTLNQLKERLRASEPELVEEIEELEKEKGKLVDQAKIELREMGPGTHTFGDYKFSVTSGGTKKIYNSDDVAELAEELGHVEILRQYKVLKTEVDSTQIERLPADIRAHYVELCEVQQQTSRVNIPKSLA